MSEQVCGYDARCETCGWSSGEDWPQDLTRDDAEDAGNLHRCQPWITLWSPITGQWHSPYKLADAEQQEKQQP